MPHLSKGELDRNTRLELDERMLAFVALADSRARTKIFRELLTKTERMMLAKRLLMAVLILKRVPTHKIAKELRVSPSTVARFQLKIEIGKLSETVRFLSKDPKRELFIKKLTEILMIPFDAQYSSRNKYKRKI